MKKNYSFILNCFIVFLLCLPISVHAFLGLNETAEILPTGQYRVGIIPVYYIGQSNRDFYVGQGSRSDFAAFLDFNLEQDINARVSVGSGTTDFWASSSVKWVPFPDYQNQPALGLKGSLIYLREENINFYNTQITPLVSKKFESTYGLLIPYLGLPITFIYEKSTNNFTAMQMAIGTDWVYKKEFQVGVELDMDLAKTVTTLSIHLNFEFDETKGFIK